MIKGYIFLEYNYKMFNGSICLGYRCDCSFYGSAFMDNKIMLETRSQVPEIDMINVINLFINNN